MATPLRPLPPAPCPRCGGRLALHEVKFADRVGYPGETSYERTCTNPECPTNTAPKRIGDAPW